MPGSLRPAVSVGVFPFSLCTKYQEIHAAQGRRNEYHDGTTQSAAMVIRVRRTWRLAKRLTPAQMTTLRAWFDAHPADAFYFYSLSETSPVFTWDATGVAAAGRYLVRFASDWSQSMGIGRGDVPLDLVEVAGGPASGSPDDYSAGLNNGHGPIVSSFIYLISAHVLGVGYPAVAAAAIGAVGTLSFTTSILYDGTAWSTRTDSFALTSDQAISFRSGLQHVQLYIDGSLSGDALPFDKFYIYDCWIVITYADSFAETVRPTSTKTFFLGVTSLISGAGNAIDGSTSSYALIQRGHFSSLSNSPILQLNNWQVR